MIVILNHISSGNNCSQAGNIKNITSVFVSEMVTNVIYIINLPSRS
jgi:hypothetical protein